MNQDSFFSIGQHHVRNGSPCQDYADTFVINNISVAVVSDGCSSSWDYFGGVKRTGKTDIGSRVAVEAIYKTLDLLFKKYALITQKEMLYYLQSSYGKKELTEQLLINFEGLKINPLKIADYFATLVICMAIKEISLFICYGDGGFGYVDSNGLNVHQVEFNNNAPFYLTYMGKNLNNYIANVIDKEGNIGNINKYEIHYKNASFNTSEVINKKEIFPIKQSDFEYGYASLINNNEVEYVSVFSDGMFDFKTNWVDCIVSCHCFKNKNGEFVKRRMIRAQDKEGVNSLDDLSIAVISLID